MWQNSQFPEEILNEKFPTGKKISQQYLSNYCEDLKIDTSVLLELFVKELNSNLVSKLEI